LIWFDVARVGGKYPSLGELVVGWFRGLRHDGR
jgi:hypothetical protein